MALVGVGSGDGGVEETRAGVAVVVATEGAENGGVGADSPVLLTAHQQILPRRPLTTLLIFFL